MNTTPTQLLIIEDDPAIAHSLQTGLLEEGYAVVWHSHGRDGITYAQTHHPHLIILDIRLPFGLVKK